MEKTMKTKAAISKQAASTSSRTKIDSQLYTVGLAVVGVSALAFGIWAFASLIGGMTNSGGPIGLVAGWFKAVFGL